MRALCTVHGAICTCTEERGQFYDAAEDYSDPSGQRADEAAGREQDAREASW